jgi:predicted RNA-binding protein with PIN domain
VNKPPRLILVDGYNVIRRVSRLRAAEQARGLEAGRDALVQEIRASGILSRSRVEVVFDGVAEGPPSTPSPHPSLRLSFSRPPQNADAALLARLRARPQPEDCAVVSADRDLEWEAKKLGAQVISPETWFASLSPPARRGKARPAPVQTKPQPTLAEIDWGLAAFGDAAVEVLPEKKKTKKSERKPAPEAVDKGGVKQRRRARHLRRSRR